MPPRLKLKLELDPEPTPGNNPASALPGPGPKPWRPGRAGNSAKFMALPEGEGAGETEK
jgi:hypothetical protein